MELSQKRLAHTASKLSNDRILVVGGAGFMGSTHSSTEIIDLTSSTISAGPSLVDARKYHTATTLNDGRILVVGGLDSGGSAFTSVEIFDPTANSGAGGWTSGPNTATPHAKHTATLLSDGRVLVVGGKSTMGETNVVEVFDPTANSGVGSWTTLSTLTDARSKHTATLMPNGKVLVAAGEASLTSLNSIEIFDPTTNSGAGSWTTGPTLTTARTAHGAIALENGKILIAGGNDSGDDSTGLSIDSSEIFDPSANSGAGAWAAGPNFATSRAYFTMTKLNDGKILVAGGVATVGGFMMVDRDILSSGEVFDEDGNSGLGEWESVGDMGSLHSEHTATLVDDGRVFFVAGGGGFGQISSIEYFSPNTSRGYSLGSLVPEGSEQPSTLLADGRVMISGGTDKNALTNFKTAYLYDPNSNGGNGGWSSAPSMSIERRAHAMVTLNDGRVMAIGGLDTYNATALATTEFFDPAANGGRGAWTAGPSMSRGRSGHTATLLANGRVLVTGGKTSGDAEIFNPAANSGAGGWSDVASTPANLQDTYSATATLMTDGRVLIAAGNGLNIIAYAVTNKAYIYDPAANGGAGGWASAPDLVDARHLHTATSLSDGRVVVMGGIDGSGTTLDTVEIFDPTANSGAGAWTSGTTMPTGRNLHTATKIADGNLIVAGGAGVTSTDIFDARGNSGAGAWTSGPALSEARAGAIAQLLNDGRVLLVRNYGTTSDFKATALYSPFETTSLSISGGTAPYNGIVTVGTGTVLQDGVTSKMKFVPNASGTATIEIEDAMSLTGEVDVETN